MLRTVSAHFGVGLSISRRLDDRRVETMCCGNLKRFVAKCIDDNATTYDAIEEYQAGVPVEVVAPPRRNAVP
jgi:hypothetical protein